ncbi:unnamed protein product [Musa textilis]
MALEGSLFSSALSAAHKEGKANGGVKDYAFFGISITDHMKSDTSLSVLDQMFRLECQELRQQSQPRQSNKPLDNKKRQCGSHRSLFRPGTCHRQGSGGD